VGQVLMLQHCVQIWLLFAQAEGEAEHPPADAPAVQTYGTSDVQGMASHVVELQVPQVMVGGGGGGGQFFTLQHEVHT
jgi:hypothetical protein